MGKRSISYLEDAEMRWPYLLDGSHIRDDFFGRGLCSLDDHPRSGPRTQRLRWRCASLLRVTVNSQSREAYIPRISEGRAMVTHAITPVLNPRRGCRMFSFGDQPPGRRVERLQSGCRLVAALIYLIFNEG